MRRGAEFDIPPSTLRHYHGDRPSLFFSHPLGVFSLGWFGENGWSIHFHIKTPSVRSGKVRPTMYFHKGGHRLNLKMRSLYAPPASPS